MSKRRKSRRTDPRCNGKVRYRGPKEAKAAVRSIQSRGDRRQKTPDHSYQCRFCNGWHLTSQTR